MFDLFDVVDFIFWFELLFVFDLFKWMEFSKLNDEEFKRELLEFLFKFWLLVLWLKEFDIE